MKLARWADGLTDRRWMLLVKTMCEWIPIGDSTLKGIKRHGQDTNAMIILLTRKCTLPRHPVTASESDERRVTGIRQRIG